MELGAAFIVENLIWGALKLTASLVTAGFKKLIDTSNKDGSLVTWSGDVVAKSRDKSQQHHQHSCSSRSPAMAPMSRALEKRQNEIQSGLETVSRDIRAGLGAIGADVASVRASVDESRAENMEFFARFTAGLEATQNGIDIMRSGPLQEAEMSLKDFQASNGNVRYLEVARSKAMTALVQGHTLDVKLSAATIAVAAGYVAMSKTDSPSEAKNFTVNGTLENVIKTLAPIWANPANAATADGKKVLSVLLSLVSCVCVLPPESEDFLSRLDGRLLPAIAALCAAEPDLCRRYPEVGRVSVEAVLGGKTMLELCVLARANDVDISRCDTTEVVRTLVASGKRLESAGNATTDRAVLLELFRSTSGPFWFDKEGCGTSAPLGQWDGVTIDDGSRVTRLDLQRNNLNGPILPELGNLGALQILYLHNNQLSGSIPPELGYLAALQKLNLRNNQLSGAIPKELGAMAKLEELCLDRNKLTGPIPPELGDLVALTYLDLEGNQLSGTIPASLGKLGNLRELNLSANKLSGAIPPELGQLGALLSLKLGWNELSGEIPASLGQLGNLQELHLSGNNLSGNVADVRRMLPACHVFSYVSIR